MELLCVTHYLKKESKTGSPVEDFLKLVDMCWKRMRKRIDISAHKIILIYAHHAFNYTERELIEENLNHYFKETHHIKFKIIHAIDSDTYLIAEPLPCQ